VDQAFACSYRVLSASAAHLFRTLATTLDPGSAITAEEAAALMTTSLPAGRRAAGLPTPDRRRPHASLCRPSTANAVIGVHSKIAAGGGAPRGCSRR
jgi:hypothetical protein